MFHHRGRRRGLGLRKGLERPRRRGRQGALRIDLCALPRPPDRGTARSRAQSTPRRPNAHTHPSARPSEHCIRPQSCPTMPPTPGTRPTQARQSDGIPARTRRRTLSRKPRRLYTSPTHCQCWTAPHTRSTAAVASTRRTAIRRTECNHRRRCPRSPRVPPPASAAQPVRCRHCRCSHTCSRHRCHPCSAPQSRPPHWRSWSRNLSNRPTQSLCSAWPPSRPRRPRTRTRFGADG